MAARDSDTRPDAGKSGEGSKAKGGGSRGRPPPDAVVRALAEVEQTLERLKQVRAERAEAETRFKTELATRDEQIEELRGERDTREARLAELEASLAEQERAGSAAIGGAAARTETAEAERDQAVEKLDEFERRLGELEAAIDTERATRELVETKLAEAEASAQTEAEQFRQQLGEAEQRERELGDTRDRERTEAESAIEDLRGRLAAAEGAAGEQMGDLRQTIASLESRSGEAEARSAELESLLGDAEHRAGDAEHRAGEAEHRAGETASHLEASNSRLEELEAALSARAEEVEEASQNASILGAKIAEQDSELDRLRGELAETQATIASRDQQLAASGESAQAEVAELRSQLEQRENEAAEMRGALEAAEHAAAARAEAGDDAAEALESLRLEAEQRVESVKAELESSLESERAVVHQLTEKLDLAADRLVEMQTALDERDRAIEQSGDVDETVAELSGEVNDLRARLAEAERQRDEACAGSGDAQPAAPWGDSRVELRRQRLRRCRALLREREVQAARQKEVLEQRVMQCDEVLGRRRELSEARQIIERTHKKIASGRARSGAAASVFFGLAIVTVLSGLSWAIVTRTFPARYAASAVLAADFTDGGVGEGDVEAWQKFHEELLLDPNVMARVGERMIQRGFVDMGQPAIVKAMLEEEMTWSSPQAGKLVIELRGLGREATMRRLDTYVTTLAVEANALRQRRSETSTTVVIEPARAGTEPIVDPRLQYAGIGVGGGTVLSFILWFGLWRRMVKTKSAFENATEIEGLLEEAKWVDPIQQIIDARGDEDDAKAA